MKPLLYRDQAGREEIARMLTEVLRADAAVVFAYLHGSFLTATTFHDVDVAVWASGDEAARTRLPMNLSDRLSARCGLPVDVRVLNDAPLAVTFHALQGQLLTTRDEERLADTIEDTARRYLDIEPILRHATVEAFAP